MEFDCSLLVSSNNPQSAFCKSLSIIVDVLSPFLPIKDLAEKLIRNMKEGTELRPINHITKEAIIGYLVIVFLTNCLIQLTHFLNNDNVDKNLKLLKKKLNSLTVTVIYDKGVFKFSVLSNISQEIREILGDSLKEFAEKPPDWI